MSEKLRVLVADDDRRMVKTICDILRLKGHEAEAAASGEEALERVRARRPDCVLMDVKMSGWSGIDTLRKIKAVHRELPVVLMSAFATEEQIAEARGLGAATLLVKPFEVEELIGIVEAIGRKLRRADRDETP